LHFFQELLEFLLANPLPDLNELYTLFGISRRKNVKLKFGYWALPGKIYSLGQFDVALTLKICEMALFLRRFATDT